MINNWMKVKDLSPMRTWAEEYGILHKQDRCVKCPICFYENKTQPPGYFGIDYFYCHKCHEWRDIYGLYIAINGGSKFNALEKLATRVGLQINHSEEVKNHIAKTTAYAKFAKERSNLPEKAYNALIARGLTDDFIKKKLLGWVPDIFKNDPDIHLKKVGLPNLARGRVLIPFFQYGEIVYFTSYSIKGEHPKYKNIMGPKTFIGTPRGPELIITEGIFDQLLSEQAGYNCIGIAGSSGEIEIPDSVKKVILIMDGDKDGRRYTEKYAVMLKTPSRKIEVGILDEGTDLADFLKDGGKIENIKTY